jgi:uncharacterized membrane protein YfcA
MGHISLLLLLGLIAGVLGGLFGLGGGIIVVPAPGPFVWVFATPGPRHNTGYVASANWNSRCLDILPARICGR